MGRQESDMVGGWMEYVGSEAETPPKNCGGGGGGGNSRLLLTKKIHRLCITQKQWNIVNNCRNIYFRHIYQHIL